MIIIYKERYHTITTSYFRYADGVVLTYDTTSYASFKSLSSHWLPLIKRHCRESGHRIVLVGTKCDDVGNREVSVEEAQSFAQEHHITLFETSAKNSVGVVESFLHLIKEVKRMKLGGGGGDGNDDNDDDWEMVERADVVDIDQKKNTYNDDNDSSWCT